MEHENTPTVQGDSNESERVGVVLVHTKNTSYSFFFVYVELVNVARLAEFDSSRPRKQCYHMAQPHDTDKHFIFFNDRLFTCQAVYAFTYRIRANK